jgi:hypothetical protein
MKVLLTRDMIGSFVEVFPNGSQYTGDPCKPDKGNVKSM